MKILSKKEITDVLNAKMMTLDVRTEEFDIVNVEEMDEVSDQN